jgi:peptidoglycan L-alanyl-D-glutamate endopeptidase CwlK
MASRRITDAHPRLKAAYEFSKRAFEEQFPLLEVILTCTHRSAEEQDKLYNQPWDGIDNDGDGKIDERDEKVTNAKAGQSKHNVYPSLAIDVAFKKRNAPGLDWGMAPFSVFYKLMKSYDSGIRWGANVKYGGHFKSLNDAPHYEL